MISEYQSSMILLLLNYFLISKSVLLIIVLLISKYIFIFSFVQLITLYILNGGFIIKGFLLIFLNNPLGHYI